MQIQIPKGPMVTAILYIVVGLGVIAAPHILEKMQLFDSHKVLVIFRMVGMLMVFGGGFGALINALDSDDRKNKRNE